MDSELDRDIRAWAVRIARAYASATRARDPVTPETEAWLARTLRAPLADCLGIAIPPSEWSTFYINPTLTSWEAMIGRKPGPRLSRVDYGASTVSMVG